MSEKTLAQLMADAAREMREHKPVRILLQEGVEAAARDIDSCDAASISIIGKRRRILTPASTGDDALRSEKLQYEVDEGPCLDAIWQQKTVQSADLRDDPRWPSWGARMADEVGFRSMAAFQLYTEVDNLGALSLYSRDRDAFSPTDVDYAEALAAHLAVALAAARIIDGLDEAILARTDIGVAIGIIMERYSVDRGRAFAVLTRLSSHTNRKVRDIAAEVAAGEPLPEAARRSPAP